MGATLIVARRELAAYFATPVAYVFIVIFLVMTGALTFTLGNFFGRGVADLQPFFGFVPWLFLFLVPALTMRLWAEERRLGTIALALTFPLVITVNYLGNPDNGVIAAGYAGCLLVAGAFLAVGAAISALTKNQVIAFVLTVAVCFLFTAAGSPVVTEFLSVRIPVLVEIARGVSITERLGGFSRGVVSLPDLVFFASFIGFWLFANAVIVDHRKAD
jgi:ABC-2 type transport system permease protein